MAWTEIWDLEIPLAVEDHIWERHHITLDQLYAILESSHLVTDNRADRTASHILIGLDDQGRCIAAPILRTDDPRVWRVVTAWYCKKGEDTILRRHRGRW